jgi:methionyl aminopeptidase
VTAYIGGYHGDLNETFTVGTCDAASKALIKTTHDALAAAVAACKPGVRFRDLGDIISRHVSQAGCVLLRSFCLSFG